MCNLGDIEIDLKPLQGLKQTRDDVEIKFILDRNRPQTLTGIETCLYVPNITAC